MGAVPKAFTCNQRVTSFRAVRCNVAAPPVPTMVEAGTFLSEVDGCVFHHSLINDAVKRAEYAVRGELHLKAVELQEQGRTIIYTNVGNPHTLKQRPLTFNRQVLALCAAPFLLQHPAVLDLFPADAVQRATQLVGYMNGGVGAYSDTCGAMGIRQEVANFIAARDGHHVSPESIFLTDGASTGIKTVMQLLIRDERDAILVPVPQYPLYSASITLCNGSFVGYFLEESTQWAMNIDTLQDTVDAAKAQGKAPRGMVVINPGNPTGQCLSLDNLQFLVKFCVDNRILLMADEVYQPNVYQSKKPYISLHKVALDMGEPYASKLELISFHTISKGVYGECGLRGGYMHLLNIDQGTVDEMYKVASINLCPNTMGQVMTGLMCNEPKEGQPSYEQFMGEKRAIFDTLSRKAQLMTEFCRTLEGVTCNVTEGAMYAFPQLRLPAKAAAAAEAAGKAQDVFYCLRLLEATGISTVPGTGFQQAPGTFHLRTTILPDEADLPAILDSWRRFHESFLEEYR